MAEPTMEEGILINVEGALQPCNICGRTFLPEPLTKHMRVCERNATRKRKVFDSLKQRVEGTELAQFHQRTYLKRQHNTPSATPEANRRSSKWRDKHLELVNTIRAARGVPIETPMSPKRTQSSSTAGSERCPSCDRQFGPKAYDRHVEWCKEHRARVQKSPADVLLAKERLEARTKYRVPPPKSKRTLIREKYSPTLGHRTESSNSIKSVSCSNLERSPSIRKQRSVLNTKTEREQIKYDHQHDPSAEIQTKFEENLSKQLTKEKSVPKEHKIPVIDGIKSSHPLRRLPRSKLNTTEINSGVEGMTVSHMKMGPGEMAEPRMVTWKDTICNSTAANIASINAAVVKKSTANNKKLPESPMSASEGNKTTIFRNESRGIGNNKKNLNEDGKCKKNSFSRNCAKIHLSFNTDSCSPHSSRSVKEINDEIGLKHTSKTITFRSVHDFKDTSVTDNGGHLNLHSIDKNSTCSLKSNLQVKNYSRQSLEAEDVESDSIMTTKLKVPFAVSKYRKTKVASDEKLKTMEKRLQFSSKTKCPTISEHDEDELNIEKESYESKFTCESVTPKILSPKNFLMGNMVVRSPKHVTENGCSFCPDMINQSSTIKTATVCESSNIQNQDDDDITADNSFLRENLGIASQIKMYDSHKLKSSDFLCTVQDICNKEKHSTSNELKNDWKRSKTHIQIGCGNVENGKLETEDDFENISVCSKKGNNLVVTSGSNKSTKPFVLQRSCEENSNCDDKRNFTRNESNDKIITSFAIIKHRNHEENNKEDEENVRKQNLEVDGFKNIYAFGGKENKRALPNSNDKPMPSFAITNHRNLKKDSKDDEQIVRKQNFEMDNSENILAFEKKENGSNDKINKPFTITERRSSEENRKDDDANLSFRLEYKNLNERSKKENSEKHNLLPINSFINNNIGATDNEDLENIYANENLTEIAIQTKPHENIVSAGKAIPFKLKFGNCERQTANILNIDLMSMYVGTSSIYSEQNKTIKNVEIDKSISNNVNVVGAIEDTYVTSCEKTALDSFGNSSLSSTTKSWSNENTLDFKNRFDFDSLENCNKRSNSNSSIANEKTNTFNIPSSPRKQDMESNYNSIDGISILYKPSNEVAEVDSLECINVDTWNEALSMARIKQPPRKCYSAVCLNPHLHVNKRSHSELDLTTLLYANDAVFQGRHTYFQYQTDDMLVEGERIELESTELDGWTSDQILEIAGDQFLASFTAAGDGLASTGSSVSSLDCVPIKRRKLNPNGLDPVAYTGTSSENSSESSVNLHTIAENILNKNLNEIKSRKKKFEQELGGGEVVTACERYDILQNESFESSENVRYGNEILQGVDELVKICTNNGGYTKSYRPSDIDINRYYETDLDYDLQENFEEETAGNSSVGTQSMKNQNNYNYNKPALSEAFNSASPRLLNILKSIITADDIHVKSQNYRNEDMLLISKDHCKKLIELDPHTLGLASKIKFPEIQLKHEKISSNNQKLTAEEVERLKFTLPPIKLCASKIPIPRSSLGHQGSNTSRCSKEPYMLTTFPSLSSSSDKQSDYNPFVTAERQLMELLECDDFKPFFRNKSPSTQQLQRPHTTTNTKSKLTDIHKNNKVVKSAENARKSNIKSGPISKRSSVIDPPTDFQDNLNVLNDDFELIERLINQNYADGYDMNNDLNDINFDSISNKIAKTFFLHSDANENNNSGFTTKERKYSDDLSSIDPRLINENDNLSIPENLKVDDNSSNSSIDNVRPLISNLNKQNYESKRASKVKVSEKINRSLDQHNSLAVKKPKQINERSIKPLKQATKGTYKSTASLTSSYGSTRNNLNIDKKRNLSSLKRSVSLVDPVKPKNLRNKQDVQNYFDEQDRKNTIKAERLSPDRQVAHRGSPDRQVDHRTSPDRQALKSQKSESNIISNTPTAEELFSVDDEMYEEYKKYEEMYLREKQQHMQTEKKPDDLISSGTLTPNEGSDNVPMNVKVSADSAYSRNTPKIRARSTKLAPLECPGSQASPLGSPNSSGSEASPTFHNRSTASQRMSKFCHECGNKYPINTAKFCVECGIRRLVL